MAASFDTWIKVGDVLIGNHCNWQVESFLARGTCSQVFQVKSVGGVLHKERWLTAAVKVFKEGKSYDSSAWNEVNIQRNLTNDAEVFPDCIGKDQRCSVLYNGNNIVVKLFA